MTVEL